MRRLKASKRPLPPGSASAGAGHALLKHIVELRRRLLIAVGTVLVLFLALLPFADRLFEWLAKPLLERLPPASHLVAIHVAAPFLTPLKFAFIVAFFAGVPVLLYQLWAFVAPALYRHERRMIVPLLATSVALFYCGMAFAYFAVFPVMFRFFVHVVPRNVTIMADISSYLGFVTKVFFAFGVAFEIPVAVVLLSWTGAVSTEWLRRQRGYVLIGCFAVGAFFAPPDVFSQFLLAVPMYLLYECGLLLARYLKQPARLREASDGERT